MKLLDRYKSSFAAKLNVMLLLGTTLTLVLVFVLNNLRTREKLAAEVITNNETKMELFVSQISQSITFVESMVQGREMLVLDNIDDKAKLETVVEEMAEKCALNTVYLALNPEYTDSWMVETYRRDDGRLALRTYGKDYPYTQYPYYVIPSRLKQGYWTSSYLTSASSEKVIAYSHPILSEEGEVMGVLGADIPLEMFTDSITDMISMHTSYLGSYMIIVGSNGSYICHIDKDKIANETYVTDARENRTPELERVINALDEGLGQCEVIKMYGRKTMVIGAALPAIGWKMLLVTPFDELYADVLLYLLLSFIWMAIGVLVSGVIIYQIIVRRTNPINVYSAASRKIAGGDFDTPVELTKSGDELQILGESLDYMRTSLKQYMGELMETTARRESLEKELSIAHDIQMSMLPGDLSASLYSEDVDVAAVLNPAKEVGGDLYYYIIKDGQLFFIIGDVSGKGVPASLVMAQTICLFKAQDAQASPHDIVTLTNRMLSEHNDRNMFVTLIVGKLDLATGQMAFCNAGHDPMFRLREGRVEKIEMFRNVPVGLMEGFHYKGNQTVLQPGDKLVLYTDGIAEAENLAKELYTIDRMTDTLSRCHGKSSREIIDTVVADVAGFVQDAPQSDDITMLCMQYKGHKNNQMTRTIVFKNRMEEVPRISAFLEEIGQELSIDFSTMNALQLAIEEAVVNVINYAYPDRTDCDSSLRADYQESCLTFTLTDSGLPFDPTGKQDPDISLGIEDRPIGGLGIFLIKKIMNEVSYQYIGKQNVLTMIKRVEKRG